MKWDNNLLLEGDDPDLVLRGQFQMAMHAMHLSCGNSIQCRQIKVGTIEQCILAAASFLSFFMGVDCRKDDPSHKHMGHILAPVYKDIKRYDELPDKKNPYTGAMHLLAKSIASHFPANSLVAALTDTFEQGICAWYRLSECAQPSTRHDIMHPLEHTNPNVATLTRAFVPVDFRAQFRDLTRAVGLAILLRPLIDMDLMWATWRVQKNNRNGEVKLFARNPNEDGFCFPSAVCRSLERFQRLMLLDPRIDPERTPLTIHWSPTHGSVRLVNAIDIETFIRRLAMTIHNLDPVADAEEIQKWSSRSLRIGAAVALHAMGFSAVDVQWTLRWRSTAFMEYLRNVAALSQRQNEALDRAAALPFI